MTRSYCRPITQCNQLSSCTYRRQALVYMCVPKKFPFMVMSHNFITTCQTTTMSRFASFRITIGRQRSRLAAWCLELPAKNVCSWSARTSAVLVRPFSSNCDLQRHQRRATLLSIAFGLIIYATLLVFCLRHKAALS